MACLNDVQTCRLIQLYSAHICSHLAGVYFLYLFLFLLNEIKICIGVNLDVVNQWF